MRMGRKIWLALALAAALAACLVATAAAVRRDTQTDPRPRTVTRGLDYFHAQQKADGGFGSMAATEWVIIGAVASGERIGSSMWTVGGKNPFSYLQANDHAKAATGTDSDNAPVYYAQAILSYVAADQADRVFVAGTPHVDLLAELYSYQDMVEGSETFGSFSPASSDRQFKAVHTTNWAILAMQAMGVTDTDRFRAAEKWLATQQKEDGGFPAQASLSSDCLDTALAIQALTLAAEGTVDAAVLPTARQFLKTSQSADGGFPLVADKGTDAEATAAAIQAILALGETPDDTFWAVGSGTPRTALAALQQKTGAYLKRKGDSSSPLPTTAWAITALRDKPFTTYPATRPPALKAFVFRPRVLTTSPRNGVKYSSNTVLIRATYTDGTKGTGVNPKKCRVFVDGTDRTKPADIGAHALHLQLKNVPNGAHTYRLEIVDYAGNVKRVERSFVVAVPTPIPVPTVLPTYIPAPTIYPTPTPAPTTSTPEPYPTTPYPYPTLTPEPSPETTTTPSPYESGYPISGTPVSSPTPSGSAEASGTADGGTGSAAGFLGGTLLAMLPIGALISYLVLNRREHALGEASEGKVLPGGGSAWDRLKGSLAKVKDIFKPAGR
jgi:hypothetical protein